MSATSYYFNNICWGSVCSAHLIIEFVDSDSMMKIFVQNTSPSKEIESDTENSPGISKFGFSIWQNPKAVDTIAQEYYRVNAFSPVEPSGFKKIEIGAYDGSDDQLWRCATIEVNDIFVNTARSFYCSVDDSNPNHEGASIFNKEAITNSNLSNGVTLSSDPPGNKSNLFSKISLDLKLKSYGPNGIVPITSDNIFCPFIVFDNLGDSGDHNCLSLGHKGDSLCLS